MSDLPEHLDADFIREKELQIKALEVWVESDGKYPAVRRALNLANDQDAKTLVDKALDDWYEDRRSKPGRIIASEELRIMRNRGAIDDRLQDGDLAALQYDLKAGERVTKMYGAEEDQETGASITIIGAEAFTQPRPPTEIVEGEVVEEDE